jgi:hypothetical protein
MADQATGISLAASHANPSGSVKGPAALPTTIRCDPVPLSAGAVYTAFAVARSETGCNRVLIPLADRPQVRTLVAESEPTNRLAGFVGVTAQVNSRTAPIYRPLD